jgi:predicted lipid-binding transport protein (Tim44 family)
MSSFGRFSYVEPAEPDERAGRKEVEGKMVAALIVLVLLLLLLGGGGFLSAGLHILWILLLIGLVLWLLGFVFRGSSGGRWYRW